MYPCILGWLIGMCRLRSPCRVAVWRCLRGGNSGRAAVHAYKLRGGRFKEAELPFFMLGDLASLQEMVVEVAKWLFKKEHGRERVSPDFNQSYLKIVGLRSGSSVVEIDVGTTRPILPDVPVHNHEHFEGAVERIVDVVGQAERGAERLNGGIPSQYMAYFNHVGRSLLPSETMEITTHSKNTANLTQKVREVLVRHSGGEIMRDITVRGTIPEVDLQKMKFRLRPIHGPTIPNCPLLEQHRDAVLAALNSYKNGEHQTKMQVRVQMTGIYDKQDRLQCVESIRGVEPLDQLDVGARLDEFRNLRDGWLDGEGMAPEYANLDWLSEAFGLYYPGYIPLPRTYPMANGGVSLEWSFGVRDVDVEIDLERRVGELCVFNRDTKKCEEDEDVKLDVPDGWRQIADRLRPLKGKMG